MLCVHDEYKWVFNQVRTNKLNQTWGRSCYNRRVVITRRLVSGAEGKNVMKLPCLPAVCTVHNGYLKATGHTHIHRVQRVKGTGGLVFLVLVFIKDPEKLTMKHHSWKSSDKTFRAHTQNKSILKQWLQAAVVLTAWSDRVSSNWTLTLSCNNNRRVSCCFLKWEMSLKLNIMSNKLKQAELMLMLMV